MLPFVILGIVLIIILAYCMLKGKPEAYTRTTLSGLPSSRFIRTPVDYVPKVGGSIMNDPHWRADPGDKNQPVENGVDFNPDLRRLANGQLFKEFENTYVAGTGEPFVPNDTKTRFELKELGDMVVARKLDNATRPGQENILTEEVLAEMVTARDPGRLNKPYIGGPGFFHYDLPGTF